MKSGRTIPGPVLMLISILGIAAFLVYWLVQNFEREEKTLSIKTGLAFGQTIRHLQAAKLKLDFTPSMTGDKIDVEQVIKADSNTKTVFVKIPHKEDIVSAINVIQGRMKDSLRAEGPTKERMTISINETSMSHATDMDPKIPEGSHDGYFRFLYGVDSMQDSLRISEIDSAFRLAIVKENVRVPFSIIKMDSACPHPENSDNMVTIGFAKPVTYQLRLGNTAFYLFKRIGLPVIFSCLLLGITVLAFVMLYRNMIRQRRLGELKNEFISNITHELKTPIATAGVAIEALKNFNAIQDPQRTKEYLDISSHELQRLSLLADKVLKLSMFEKTEVEMVPEEINLEGIIGEVLTSLKIQFEKYHATITLSSQGNMNMKGDRLHLQSVIFNLLDNALKYGKEGPVIKIELREKENTILLQVSDDGIGIAPEYKEKVFEKFFRVPHGDTHNTKGYGLGLSYAAQVIQKHGGTITVDSQPGKPTRFIIELPKKPA